MANVSHASLTGSNLHEPKGIASAALGTVYVADGAGSGSWNSVGTSAFTGMIADFAAPIAPAGWLELDGSVISTATYSGLFAVLSLTTSGTRTNGNPIITSIPDTSNMVIGYYVFGTGISTGTTIVSIDSGTQITLSGNASSSGTSSFFVSPFLMNTGTIKLPDVKTNARYRRSRGPGIKVGDALADQNQAHTHSLSVSGTTSSDGAHTHTASVTDPGHDHFVKFGIANLAGGTNAYNIGAGSFVMTDRTGFNTTGISVSNASNGAHTHTVTSTGTSGSSGSAEARPLTLVVLTCIKT